MIEMVLSRVILQDTRDHHFIFLKEKQGHRSFPIVIGAFEAQEIWRQALDEGTKRPLTHELVARVMTSLNGILARIVVNDLRQNTFFAQLILSHDGQEIEIDARPSDAIAMATRFQSPIFVEDHVLEQVLRDS